MQDEIASRSGQKMLRLVKSFLKGGARRELGGGWLSRIIAAYAAGIAIYAVWVGAKAVIDPLTLTSIFLCAAYVIVFLTMAGSEEAANRGPTITDYVLSALSFASGVYFVVNAERFATRILLLDPLYPLDTFFGVTVLLLTLEATRRTVGIGLTSVVILVILYTLFGHALPGQLWHRPVTVYHFLDQIVFSINGIFGLPARVAATYAFLFVMFGTFVQRAGAGEFLFNLSAAVAGRSVGGPAKVAVVSSGLFGTISGSPTADVVTTGSITIPMMKRVGYPATFAGAVETAASTGGSILPPVMGSAAFLMAEIAGIPYASIAFAALIPALLYYEAIYLQVHLRARSLGLAAIPSDKIPSVSTTLRVGWQFIIPLVVLVWFLAQGYTVSLVALVGTLSVFLISWMRANTRMGPLAVYDCFATTTLRVVPVAAACAAAGMVIGLITMTGLAGKVARLLFSLSGGQLLFVLLFAGIVLIVLGMGMPTPSAYVLGAVLVVPALLDQGVPLLSAHLFAVYFAVLAAITPPVAVAAYAAAGLAEASPLRIAQEAVKLSIVAFVIPFMFVYQPALLLQEGILQGIIAFATATVGVAGLAAGLEGRLLVPLCWRDRLVVVIGGLGMMYPGLLSDVLGLALIGSVFLAQVLQTGLLRRKRATVRLEED